MHLQLQAGLKAFCGSTIGWHHQKATEFKTVIHTLHMHIVLWYFRLKIDLQISWFTCMH